MASIKMVDSNFNSLSKSIDCHLDVDSKDTVNVPAVHQIIKATLAGRRAGNACTKNRALISGGGAKPFKQKGTGRARQGSNRSPLLRGGGTVFGPSPRSYDQKVNKKLVLKAIASVLADKHQAEKLFVVDKLELSGKTSELNKKLEAKGIKSVLIVTDDRNSLALRAVRNLQYGGGLPVEGFSVYEAVKYENLIVEEAAFKKLLSRLG